MTIKEAQEHYADGLECYTDYPIPFFDTTDLVMKKCYILEPPDDKYVDVLVVDNKQYATYSIKAGYLYRQDQIKQAYIFTESET